MHDRSAKRRILAERSLDLIWGLLAEEDEYFEDTYEDLLEAADELQVIKVEHRYERKEMRRKFRGPLLKKVGDISDKAQFAWYIIRDRVDRF